MTIADCNEQFFAHLRDACPGCGTIYPIPHLSTCTRLLTLAMPTEPTPVPAPQPSLRKAALEALCSAEAFLASSAGVDEERFRKALDQLAEALAQ